MNEPAPSRPGGRSVLSNASWNAFGTLFNIVITFLLAPLLIHRLGVDQWGLLLLVWSLTGVLGLANFGFGEATLRFVSHHHAAGDMQGVNRVVGSTLTYYVAVCAAIIAALGWGAPQVAQWVKAPAGTGDTVEALVRLSAVLFALGMLTNAFRGIPMALRRYDISNKVGTLQGVVRSAGLVLLVLAHFGVVQLVLWEVLLALVVLGVQIVIARRMLPGLRCTPSMSLQGLREVIGYSMFSFMTHMFLLASREAPKLLVGNRLGTASVAYLGTPDSISNRLHMVIVSAIETLVPRFSGPDQREAGRALLTVAIWASFACGAVLYVPLAVLMPDFLRLWISPEFAQQSGRIGQLLTLSLIGSIGFTAIATLFRGIGRPAFVTAVMALVASVVLVGSVLALPRLGVVGVAWALLASALVSIGGVVYGWLWLYGTGSLRTLVRIAVVPLLVAAVMFVLQSAARQWWGEPGWLAMLLLGTLFAGLGAVTIVVIDLLLKGDSPAATVTRRLLGPARVAAIRVRIGLDRRAR